MKVSMNWLKQFVELEATPQQVAEVITQLAFECESIERVVRYVDGVVVGEVLESTPHPDADRLSLTRVDVGGEVLPIVCGAPNCRAGLKVAVARPGVRIGEIVIEPRKLRGQLSHGMILSEREMNISEEGKGILELPDGLVTGSKLTDLVEGEDTILDFEITVNRPDALSHLGIARELAAYYRKPLRLPALNLNETDRPASDRITVEILAPEFAARYVARMVEGVEVGASPIWMKSLLHSLGQRPINAIVDITNYVLFELGHPLHAFDYHLVKDGRVIVRMGNEGEKLTTLDGRERKVGAQDILIADPEKAIGLGGVMGGANTEVGDETHDILIEAAWFDPPTIRRTAKSQGLATEASKRFERGSDPEMPLLAAARCAALIQQIAGGEVLKGMVDAYPSPIVRPSLTFRPSRAVQVLGVDVTAQQARDIFDRLELASEIVDEDTLHVQVPSFRHDLEREIDLVEEVIRHMGYGEVPTADESRVVLNSVDDPVDRIVDTALDTLVAEGFREVVCSAMTSQADQVAFSDGVRCHSILKPVNPEMNAYRATLVPPLLRVVEHNLNRGVKDLRLVEIGQAGGKGWLGVEAGQRMHLAFAVVGASAPQSYDRAGDAFDLPDLKGVLVQLATGLSLDNDLQFSYDIPGNLLHGVTLCDTTGSPVLVAGLLQAEVAARFGIEVPVFVGEIDLERWVGEEKHALVRPGLLGKYRSFSRYPANTRDAAFLVPVGVKAGMLIDRIKAHAGDLLEDVELFDLYEGKPLPEGERSLAFRLTFRAQDRTLADEEVDQAMQKVVDGVQSIEHVRLRGLNG